MENLKSQLRFLQEIEAKEITEQAEKQAKEILQEAKQKAEKIRNEKMKEVSEKLREKETTEIASVKLEGKRNLSVAKFQLFEETLTKTSTKLREIGTTDKVLYKESMERLITEAATRLNANELEILTNSNDKKLVKERLKDLEKKLAKQKNAPVSLLLSDETPSITGGVIVRTKDKRQIFNNTWEARLARVREEMADKIFVQLFAGAED